MKTILALTIIIFSQFLFAGNSVGTMSQTQEAFLKELLKQGKNPLIIFNQGEKANQIQFASGILKGKNWQVQNNLIQAAILKSDSDFNKALKLSKTTESWIVVGSVTPEKQQCIDSCIASFEKPGPELKACVVECDLKK